MFLLAPAEAAKSIKGKTASCLTGSALIGANGGIMRALTFRDRMREEAAKAAAAETADPWRLTLERVRGKVDSLTVWSASAVRRCWISLRSRNAIGLLPLFEGLQR